MVARGDIWLVELDRASRTSQATARPCLVVSPAETNLHLQTVSVAPMSSSSQPAPFRVPIRLGGKQGLVLIEQVTAVEAAALKRRLGKTNKDTLASVLAKLQEYFAE